VVITLGEPIPVGAGPTAATAAALQLGQALDASSAWAARLLVAPRR
jgi:hypothetical protein